MLTGATAGVPLNFQGFDVDGGQIVFQIVIATTNGVLNPVSRIYRPAHGFVGTDTVTFDVTDGLTNSAMATLTLIVRAPTDSDADGIPNYWEALYDINNPNDDRDGDGRSNNQEYLANTDPRDGNSVLRMASIFRATNGHSVVTWRSVGGTHYRVQFSDGNADLGFSGVFADLPRSASVEIDPSPIGVSSSMSFTDDMLPPAVRSRFFRVKVVTQ